MSKKLFVVCLAITSTSSRNSVCPAPSSNRSGAGIIYQQKMTTTETWTFYLRRLLIFVRLSYYLMPCLRLTKSSTILLAHLLASTQQVSLAVIENVTDIFSPKMGTFDTVCLVSHSLCHFLTLLDIIIFPPFCLTTLFSVILNRQVLIN